MTEMIEPLEPFVAAPLETVKELYAQHQHNGDGYMKQYFQHVIGQQNGYEKVGDHSYVTQ